MFKVRNIKLKKFRSESGKVFVFDFIRIFPKELTFFTNSNFLNSTDHILLHSVRTNNE